MPTGDHGGRMSGNASSDNVLPISRRVLLTGYAIAFVTLLLAEACGFITELTAFRTPIPRPEYLPSAFVFGFIIFLGLLAGNARGPRRFPLAGPLIACLTAAYAVAVLVLSAAAAWFDFTAWDPEYDWGGLPPTLQAFFDKHPPFQPGIGFWLFMTPFALVMFGGVVWFARAGLRRADTTERL